MPITDCIKVCFKLGNSRKILIIDPIIIPLINELNAKVLVSIKRLINFDEEIKLKIKAITKIVTSNKSYSSGNLKFKRQ